LETTVIGPGESERGRLVSLDVFRGMTIAGMILVTDPGDYATTYWPLLHAKWNGPTPTDMIFPAFLVIAGVSMVLSFASRLRGGGGEGRMLLHVVWRCVLLVLLGLLVNGFYEYDLHTIRIAGILQRIAVCYFAGALLYVGTRQISLRKRNRVIGGVTMTLLVLYWALLKYWPVPGFGAGRLDSLGNAAAYVDRVVIGVRHMWAYGTTPGYGVTYDPEGVLSTLGALSTFLIGVLAGEWMRRNLSPQRKAAGLAMGGSCLVAVALALSRWMPLNKWMWTSTFAVYSGGVALLAFCFFYLVVDVKGWRRGTTLPLVLGTNAIFVFVLSSVLTVMIGHGIHVGGRDGAGDTLRKWIYGHWFAPWLPPFPASLVYAIAIVLLNVAIVYPLYRRRIFLRV
jgi:predicted acyltransferase